MLLNGKVSNSPYSTVSDTLVDNGYAVVPCMPGSKFPGDYIGKQWYAKLGWNQYCDRMPTDFELRVWNRWPDAGACLVLDHVLKVVDIDTDDPELRAAILAVLPDSPVKKRGAKGFSAFYRGSKEIIPRSFNVRGDRILDLLAYGKQTVIPPTIHPDTGRPYVWVDGGDTLADVTVDQLPLLPDDIADRIEEALEPFGYIAPIERDVVFGDADTAWREVNSIALEKLDSWVPHLGLPRLKRNRDGYRSVAGFRPSGGGKTTDKRNLHLAIHRDGIRDWGDNDRPYSAIDLVMVTTPCDFHSAFEWLRDKLGLRAEVKDYSKMIAVGLARTAEKSAPPKKPLELPKEAEEPNEKEEKLPQHVRAPAGQINPFDTRTHGGILGAVSQWMYDSAWRPVPEFSTIGAIGLCAAIFGRRYTTPTGLGLNLYLIGLAGSGFGKDHPLKAMQALLADAGQIHLLGPGDITSDSALEFVLRQRPCFVMPMDEIGVFFQATGGRNAGGYERRIRKVFLDLYTKGDGMWTGKQKVPMQGSKAVTDNAAEPVYNPTVSIMGMSTPTEFYSGITESNLTDGMVGRMTVIAASKRPTPREDRLPLIPPRSLVDEVKNTLKRYPISIGNLGEHNWRTSTSRPVTHQVSWESELVRRKWRDIEDWQIAAIDADPSKDGIVGRSAEQTIKLATIRACSRNQEAPEVRSDDIDWGWAVVSASLWNIDTGVDKFMVNSDFEKLCNEIVAHVKQSGGSIPKSTLLRKKGMKRDPRLFASALGYLAEAQVIYPVPTAGAKISVTLKSASDRDDAELDEAA